MNTLTICPQPQSENLIFENINRLNNLNNAIILDELETSAIYREFTTRNTYESLNAKLYTVDSFIIDYVANSTSYGKLSHKGLEIFVKNIFHELNESHLKNEMLSFQFQMDEALIFSIAKSINDSINQWSDTLSIIEENQVNHEALNQLFPNQDVPSVFESLYKHRDTTIKLLFSSVLKYKHVNSIKSLRYLNQAQNIIVYNALRSHWDNMLALDVSEAARISGIPFPNDLSSNELKSFLQLEHTFDAVIRRDSYLTNFCSNFNYESCPHVKAFCLRYIECNQYPEYENDLFDLTELCDDDFQGFAFEIFLAYRLLNAARHNNDIKYNSYHIYSSSGNTLDNLFILGFDELPIHKKQAIKNFASANPNCSIHIYEFTNNLANIDNCKSDKLEGKICEQLELKTITTRHIKDTNGAAVFNTIKSEGYSDTDLKLPKDFSVTEFESDVFTDYATQRGLKHLKAKGTSNILSIITPVSSRAKEIASALLDSPSEIATSDIFPFKESHLCKALLYLSQLIYDDNWQNNKKAWYYVLSSQFGGFTHEELEMLRVPNVIENIQELRDSLKVFPRTIDRLIEIKHSINRIKDLVPVVNTGEIVRIASERLGGIELYQSTKTLQPMKQLFDLLSEFNFTNYNFETVRAIFNDSYYGYPESTKTKIRIYTTASKSLDSKITILDLTNELEPIKSPMRLFEKRSLRMVTPYLTTTPCFESTMIACRRNLSLIYEALAYCKGSIELVKSNDIYHPYVESVFKIFNQNMAKPPKSVKTSKESNIERLTCEYLPKVRYFSNDLLVNRYNFPDGKLTPSKFVEENLRKTIHSHWIYGEETIKENHHGEMSPAINAINNLLVEFNKTERTVFKMRMLNNDSAWAYNLLPLVVVRFHHELTDTYSNALLYSGTNTNQGLIESLLDRSSLDSNDELIAINYHGYVDKMVKAKELASS